MKENDTYNIKLIQRSDNVAISPGKYQIVPAGGFEILNDSSNGYTPHEILENSSSSCAVFREYLEEIFGRNEFEGHGVGSVNEVLMKDEEIYTIFDTKKILNKPATVQISKTSGLAGIAYWINQAFRLEGEEAVDKRDPLILAMKDWIDQEYEDARQTAMTDRELEEKIAELAPGLYQRG